MIKISTFLIS